MVRRLLEEDFHGGIPLPIQYYFEHADTDSDLGE